jgi:hypothetical protein
MRTSKQLPALKGSEIMLPADLERYCRMSLKSNSRHSALPIRVALKASALHGRTWFVIRGVQTSLGGVGQDASSVGEIARRLASLGIAECRKVSVAGRERHEARLRCDLVDADHFHGKCSKRLLLDAERYLKSRKIASPLAVLLLIGIHHFGLRSSGDLGKFLQPEFDLFRSKSTPGRLLNQLSDAGLVSIVRESSSPSQPFLVYPIN